MQEISYDQIRALFKLLEKPDMQDRLFLKQALSSAIKTNPAKVQQVLEEDFAESAPRGIVDLLEEICWEDLAGSFTSFVAKINPDLEEGLSLVAKFTSPTMARGKITEPLDAMAFELRSALLNAQNYREMIADMTHYIFDMRRFKTLPSAKNINDLSFSHFLQRKQGAALCMACLYACLGQRYGLNMEVADMSGWTVVLCKDEAHQDTFVVDPFNSGKVLSLEDCRSYMQLRRLPWNTNTITVLSSRQVVRRLLAQMIFLLNKVNDERRLSYLRNYLDILVP